ncbi:MAG: type II toxin-antitoxin system RelE/ParE family toxin [Patescibacteria group bacterium]
MEKWLKAASRLPSNLRKRVAKTATLILLNQLESLDVKKLRGVENTFRARVGKIRIIFASNANKNIILDVGFRDDKTYKKLR